MKKYYIFLFFLHIIVSGCSKGPDAEKKQSAIIEQNEKSFHSSIINSGDYKLLDKPVDISLVKDLSPDELRLIRNTIFARHGYRFKSPDLLEHFKKFNWYIINDDNTAKIKRGEILRKVDKNNIKILKILENESRSKNASEQSATKAVKFWSKDELLKFSEFKSLLKKGKKSKDICGLVSYEIAKVDTDRVKFRNYLLKHLFNTHFKDKKLCQSIENDPGTCDSVELSFLTRNFIEIDKKLGSFHFIKFEDLKEQDKKMFTKRGFPKGATLLSLKGSALRHVQKKSRGGDEGMSQDRTRYTDGMEGLYLIRSDCRQEYYSKELKYGFSIYFDPLDNTCKSGSNKTKTCKNMATVFFEKCLSGDGPCD